MVDLYYETLRTLGASRLQGFSLNDKRFDQAAIVVLFILLRLLFRKLDEFSIQQVEQPI